MVTNSSAAILGRLLDSNSDNLSSDAARSILRLHFSPTDHERMTELCAKASAGTLTATEGAELGEFLRVADLLALVQSKARRSLKQVQ